MKWSKKAILIFLVCMLAFTFISRAAASVTVAQVTIANAKQDRLHYVVKGIGTMKSAEEEFLSVLPGYRIERVRVSTGMKVEKDEVLFTYSMEDLQKHHSVIKTEIEKLKLQIKYAEVNGSSIYSSTTTAPQLSYEQAEENLRVAELALKEAEEDYKETAKKTKSELLKEKKQEYKEAQKKYEDCEYNHAKSLTESRRTLEDAKTEYSKANQQVGEITFLIDQYQSSILSSNGSGAQNAKESMLKSIYGGEAGYIKHKSEVSIAEHNVSRASDDLSLLEKESKLILEQYSNLVTSAYNALENAKASSDFDGSSPNIQALLLEYNNAVLNYQGKQKEFESQIKQQKRNLEDATITANELKWKDIRLDELLSAFYLSLNTSGYETARRNLYQFLLGDNAEAIEDNIATKGLALSRAEEDYNTKLQDNERELKDLTEEIAEIEKIIESMENGTYDYEEALETKKQTIKAANEAVRVARQNVASLKVQYNIAIQNDKDAVLTNKKNLQLSEITMQGYQIDLENKKKELEALQGLIERRGEVSSPSEGTITSLELVAGKTTTGEELIKIGFGGYVFKAEFESEYMERINAGDEIKIKTAGEEVGITSIISAVSLNSSGRYELTVLMLEEEYIIGERAEFEARSQSERYELCIPIQALHKDTSGYYVLVLREQEGILGSETIAVAVPVDLLGKDNFTAAVEGALCSKDNIITGSNRPVSPSDKVRIKE